VGYWKKHPKKVLEALLREFHEADWRVLNPPTYYQVKCPCGKHRRSIHLSPSDPNYARNAQAYLHRQDCYRRREGES
jgi:hypothetical protein